ncbi:hypothetical protein HNP55_003824 [Paucibacter oligotrophus]|uniref:DUF2145 domain-containing protein n=1 Tax=Roseateles oligotrophus TaxID=1769250 RepID=A0A840LJ25_9BURK|nr:DUF2145 domain-containing protein [Roseateles oligotrophus]MBB4845277.1 hypothetical protein [Roseateles oligotrophus]
MIRSLLAAGCLLLGTAAQASSTGYCDRPAPADAASQHKLLRFAEIVKNELNQSGRGLALVARSGLDLARFDQRYSHAGLSLRESENTPWSVRQLYFACDEGRPRIFDQGMAGFVLGGDDPRLGYISLLFLPPEASARLERAALDKGLALQLLNPRYSANAYAFGLQYQNCNQWVAEMLAAAWGEGVNDRAQAQAWLQAQDYRPTTMALGWRPLQWLGAFIPWVHSEDHPEQDLADLRYRVSMPASLEAFVRAQWPGSQRVELCHTENRVVLRRGWEPIAAGCVAGADDLVLDL